MSQSDSEKRRTALLENLASTLEQVGFPHLIARIYAALTLAEGEGLSTGEITGLLGISKASVSNAMQFLVGTDLVQRYRVPGSRETHYRMLKGVWGPILGKKFAAMSVITRTTSEAMKLTDSPLALERLQEMHDVYSFFEREFEQIMIRFEERK